MSKWMLEWNLQHHSFFGAHIKCLQERHNVSNIECHVVTHHHIGFWHLAGNRRPIAEKLLVPHLALRRGSRKLIQHALLMIDSDYRGRGRHECKCCAPTTAPNIEHTAPRRHHRFGDLMRD